MCPKLTKNDLFLHPEGSLYLAHPTLTLTRQVPGDIIKNFEYGNEDNAYYASPRQQNGTNFGLLNGRDFLFVLQSI